MGTRSVIGLLVLALAGVLAAWLFQRDTQPSDHQHNGRVRLEPSLSRPRDAHGGIVPLVVDEGFSGTAFIQNESVSAADPQTPPPAYRVLRQPTIQRDKAHEQVATPPQLDSSFPHQLRLLGIQDPEADSTAVGNTLAQEEIKRTPLVEPAPETTSAPRSNEVEVSHPATTPARHVIVDGDTLPQIALRYYGDPSRADEIYALNRAHIPSFELLPIGIEIALPAD